MRATASLTAAFMAAMMTGAGAQQPDCRGITDPQARLACFDKTPAMPSKNAKKPSTAPDEFAAAKTAMSKKLLDPESARYEDLFKVDTPAGPLICGIVNSRNTFGGYIGRRGFLYVPLSRTAVMMMSGASDPEYTGQNGATYCLHCLAHGDQSMADYCPSLTKSYPNAP